MPWRFLRMASKRALARSVDLEVDGLEHLPASGPGLIAARHVHHLYDGCALLATVPRPLHLVVTLDWIHSPAGKRAMAIATGSARWPAVVRAPLPGEAPAASGLAGNRRAFREIAQLLREGRLVAIFPEGYPNVDPGFTPKTGLDEMLAFQPGFARLATRMAAEGIDVPLIPAGFSYREGQRWRAVLRFGKPRRWDPSVDARTMANAVEADVRRLSGLT